MATPNYGYEKRQRELAKKQKKEEKLKAKAARKVSGEGEGHDDQPSGDANAQPDVPASTGRESAGSD